MLKIDYSKTGTAYPDFAVESCIKSAYDCSIKKDVEKKSYCAVSTSTENYLYATQALIKEGRIDFNKVEFYFEGDLVGKANRYGKIDNYPDGFGDTMDRFLDRIIGL